MRLCSLLLPLVLSLAASAGAQMFPPVPKSGTVYDGARLLSASEIGTVNAVSQSFKSREGAPIVVATIPSLASVGAKAIGVERYASMLFDQWRIGRKQRNVGILLLVARDDHKMRVELGKDLGHDYDAAVHRIDTETILPAFKKGDYAGGIVRGVEALSHLPDLATPPAQPPSGGTIDATPAPDFSSPSENFTMNAPEPSFFGGGLLCFAVPVVFFIIVVAAASKRRGGYGPSRRFGGGFGPSSNTTYVNNTYVNNGDDGFTAGMIAGEMMSQPSYDPSPSFDSSPSVDTSPSFDSGSSVDSGSSSSDGGSFDSGSSGGGGDSGSW